MVNSDFDRTDDNDTSYDYVLVEVAERVEEQNKLRLGKEKAFGAELNNRIIMLTAFSSFNAMVLFYITWVNNYIEPLLIPIISVVMLGFTTLLFCWMVINYTRKATRTLDSYAETTQIFLDVCVREILSVNDSRAERLERSIDRIHGEGDELLISFDVSAAIEIAAETVLVATSNLIWASEHVEDYVEACKFNKKDLYIFVIIDAPDAKSKDSADANAIKIGKQVRKLSEKNKKQFEKQIHVIDARGKSTSQPILSEMAIYGGMKEVDGKRTGKVSRRKINRIAKKYEGQAIAVIPSVPLVPHNSMKDRGGEGYFDFVFVKPAQLEPVIFWFKDVLTDAANQSPDKYKVLKDIVFAQMSNWNIERE